MAETATDSTPIRKLDFVLDRLPEFSSVAAPSVGFDFGSSFVRTAVVSRHDDNTASDADKSAQTKISVSLATFAKTEAAAALRYAAARLDGSNSNSKELKVYFTGHATAEDEQHIKDTFPNAASVSRRDKLTSLNKGAHLLISSDLPTDLLYFETEQAARELENLVKLYETFKMFMPPKMIEVFMKVSKSAEDRQGAKYPLTLSIIGSNNIICNLTEDSSFNVVNAHCNGGYSMEKMWNYAKVPSCPGDMDAYVKLASAGNRRGVDSCTSEIAEAIGFYSAMPPDYPIFSFGKLEKCSRHDVKPEDLARGLLAWHTDLISMKTTDCAMLNRAYPIYFTGALVQHEFVRSEILLRNNLSVFNGMTLPKFFKTDALAALGACLDE